MILLLYKQTLENGDLLFAQLLCSLHVLCTFVF